MSLPIHSPLPPIRPSSLAEAVDRARWPRNRATAHLEPHREELLRLRHAGESVGSLVGGLRLIGIEIGHETMRRWLSRELGQKPPRRKKARRLSAETGRVAEAPSGETTTTAPVGPLIARDGI